MSDLEELKATRLLIKGTIADMPEETQKQFYAAVEDIMQVVNKNAEVGQLALALAATEVGIKNEEKW